MFRWCYTYVNELWITYGKIWIRIQCNQLMQKFRFTIGPIYLNESTYSLYVNHLKVSKDLQLQDKRMHFQKLFDNLDKMLPIVNKFCYLAHDQKIILIQYHKIMNHIVRSLNTKVNEKCRICFTYYKISSKISFLDNTNKSFCKLISRNIFKQSWQHCF